MSSDADVARVDANTFSVFLREGLDESIKQHPIDRNVHELWKHWNSYTLRVIARLNQIETQNQKKEKDNSG